MQVLRKAVAYMASDAPVVAFKASFPVCNLVSSDEVRSKVTPNDMLIDNTPAITGCQMLEAGWLQPVGGSGGCLTAGNAAGLNRQEIHVQLAQRQQSTTTSRL